MARHIPVFPAAAALSGVLAVAGCNAARPATSPDPVDGPVSYSAMGASDTTGYGGSAPCLPFADCPNGTGYVQIIARRLRAEHADVAVRNLGIPGAVLSREIMTIGNGAGRGILANVIDAELPLVAADSTIVTVFGDGNGVNALSAALRAIAAPDRASYTQARIQNFARDFSVLVDGIAARAPAAQIIVITVPNLARLPYAAGYSSEEREWMRQLSVGFSAAMNAARSARVRVVDLMCHAPAYQASLYSGDGFHPNDAGYALVADLVWTALAAPPPPAPAVCPEMS